MLKTLIVGFLIASASPAYACRPAPHDDAYWQRAWTESSSVSLGRVVRVAAYTTSERRWLNRERSIAHLNAGSGLAEIEIVRPLRGAPPERVRVEYERTPACGYRWAPATGDEVMVFTGNPHQAWPQEHITLPRLRALFSEPE